MKYYQQLPLLRRNSLVTPQQQQDDDDEDPATTPSIEFKCTPLPQKRRRKTVHFCEDQNQEYENHVQCKEECRKQWYSVNDLHAFKQDTKAEMLALRAAERLSAADQESWAKSLLAVYQVFCAARSVADIAKLMPQVPVFTVSTYTVGMERRGIPAIARDAAERRAQITQTVLHWQATKLNDKLRTELMREACLTVSRPSRLYAHNVAVISAAAEL